MTKGLDEWDFAVQDAFKAVILDNGDLYLQTDDENIDFFQIKKEFLKDFSEWLNQELIKPEKEKRGLNIMDRYGYVLGMTYQDIKQCLSRNEEIGLEITESDISTYISFKFKTTDPEEQIDYEIEIVNYLQSDLEFVLNKPRLWYIVINKEIASDYRVGIILKEVAKLLEREYTSIHSNPIIY